MKADSQRNVVIVGSGPAGLAAARYLVERGLRPTLLDIGRSLPQQVSDIRESMASTSHLKWQHNDRLALLNLEAVAREKSDFSKLVFGSDYYTEDSKGEVDESKNLFYPKYCVAKGGFSVAWGAATMPYLEAEIAHWPIPAAEMRKYYKIAASHLNVIGRDDSLTELYGNYYSKSSIEPSPQIATIINRCAQNQVSLSKEGIYVGSSRNALDQGKCRLCNTCLNGCIYSAIYNGSDEIDKLITRGLEYIPGKRVDCFHDDGNAVDVSITDIHSGKKEHLRSERLLLAAGVVQTGRIVINSLNVRKHLMIKDSQYFLFPLFLQNPPTDCMVRNHQGIVLSGAFLELINDKICSKNIHIQLYSHSDLIQGALAKASFGISKIPGIASFIRSRFLIAQGYLHSDHSSYIDLSLLPTQHGNSISLKTSGNDASGVIIRRAISHLNFTKSLHGLTSIPRGLKMTSPGRGFHCGGTLPMNISPTDFQTYPNGLLYGCKKVHILDSSIFPDLCSPTITLSIYANAYRIASSLL